MYMINKETSKLDGKYNYRYDSPQSNPGADISGVKRYNVSIAPGPPAAIWATRTSDLATETEDKAKIIQRAI